MKQQLVGHSSFDGEMDQNSGLISRFSRSLIQFGEYVISRGIQNEPAFAWWVPYVMQKRNVIVSAVKLRIRRKKTQVWN